MTTTTQATPRAALADEIRSWRVRRERVRAYWQGEGTPADYDATLADIHAILGPVAKDYDMATVCTVAARVLHAFATAVLKGSR